MNVVLQDKVIMQWEYHGTNNKFLPHSSH